VFVTLYQLYHFITLPAIELYKVHLQRQVRKSENLTAGTPGGKQYVNINLTFVVE